MLVTDCGSLQPHGCVKTNNVGDFLLWVYALTTIRGQSCECNYYYFSLESGEVSATMGSGSISFMAVMSTDESVDGSDTLLVFDQVEINLGGAYNSSNGRFTAPLTGIYQFTFYARCNDASSSEYYLRLNGVRMAVIYHSYYYSSLRLPHSLSQLLCVNASHYVDIEAENGGYIEGSSTNYQTWFYGYLVHAGC